MPRLQHNVRNITADGSPVKHYILTLRNGSASGFVILRARRSDIIPFFSSSNVIYESATITRHYYRRQPILLKIAAFLRSFFFSFLQRASGNNGSFKFVRIYGYRRRGIAVTFGNEISKALWLVRYAY